MTQPTRLPNEVVVGPYRYTVLADEVSATKAKVIAEHSGNLGLMQADLTTITLNPEQSADSMADSLLHEVLHAVWQAVGLDHGPTERHEERVVRSMSPTLLDTIRRNPKLVAYLTAS